MAIKIHGKTYVEVKDRVAEFRKERPTWAIITEMVHNHQQSGTVIFKASVCDESQVVMATGHAHEWQGDKTSMVNETSHIENCETSAIGRALACLGYGIEEAFASSNEIKIAENKKLKPLAKVDVPVTEKYDDSVDAEHWKNSVVPIGKHKGKTLGSLHPNSRKWFLENFEANEQYEDSIAFRKSLDECLAETNGTSVADEAKVDIADEKPQTMEDDEDVPF